MIRDLRAGDGPRVTEFLKSEFPEEEALLGTRPDAVERIVRRIFRWDSRIVLGLLRLVGRPLFRFFVVEEGGQLVATTLLTFREGSGYVSMVVVDPAHRRKGYAKALLESARAATEKQRRPYLALDVLEANAPARALYASIGYRPLRTKAYMVRETPEPHPAPAVPHPSVRRFTRSDAAEVAAIAQKNAGPDVARVLPTRPKDLFESAWVGRLLSSESAAWVVDPGGGPQAYVGASRTAATEAGHLGSPIVAASADPEAVRSLLAGAVAWLEEARPPRILTLADADQAPVRTALEAVGFRHAIAIQTLYRPVP